jgi:sugar phosphate isomerase/epimerase
MFFSQRGNRQIIAGFYDEPLENVTAWLESAGKVPGVDGFMYTTWRNDFSKLEEVSRLLDSNGF